MESGDRGNISSDNIKGKGKKVRIFNSFKEQEDEMIRYWASITPAQRLAHLYEMIQISFRLPKDGIRHTKRSNKINFIRYEQ